MKSVIVASLCGMLMSIPVSAAAPSTCAIFGDSIGLGLSHAMADRCATNAEIGILSSVVASRVTAGDRWTIVSLGSNDFPVGLSPDMKSLSQERIRKALARVRSIIKDRLVLVVPANEARQTVQDWAKEANVPTVGFEPGPDGIHPTGKAYATMARDVEAQIGKQ